MLKRTKKKLLGFRPLTKVAELEKTWLKKVKLSHLRENHLLVVNKFKETRGQLKDQLKMEKNLINYLITQIPRQKKQNRS